MIKYWCYNIITWPSLALFHIFIMKIKQNTELINLALFIFATYESKKNKTLTYVSICIKAVRSTNNFLKRKENYYWLETTWKLTFRTLTYCLCFCCCCCIFQCWGWNPSPYTYTASNLNWTKAPTCECHFQRNYRREQNSSKKNLFFTKFSKPKS